MKISKLFFSMFILFFCASCNRYAITFRNVSDQDIKGMIYTSNNLDFGSSYLFIAKTGNATYINPPQKVPKSVKLNWTLKNGTKNEKVVNLKEIFPKSFKGEVVYELSNDDVKVVFEKEK